MTFFYQNKNVILIVLILGMMATALRFSYIGGKGWGYAAPKSARVEFGYERECWRSLVLAKDTDRNLLGIICDHQIVPFLEIE